MKIVLAVLTFLAVAVTGFCGPALDNSVVGQKLRDQHADYEAARDKVIAYDNGEIKMTSAELINALKDEQSNAVKSWVRAAIGLRIGATLEKMGNKAGALEAFKTARAYAKQAMKFTKDPNKEKVITSQSEGAKYLALAERAIKRLEKK